MFDKNKILLIICLIAVCVLPVCSSAGLPMVQFPLKPSPAEGPYQDEEFFKQADAIIYSLSNQTIPTGTTLLDLKSVQQTISKMSISPALYTKAQNVNAFLFYTGKAGTAYNEAVSLTHSPFSPVPQDGSEYSEADTYYSAAQKMWEKIKNDYPDVTLYTMKAKTEETTDSVYQDGLGVASGESASQNVPGFGIASGEGVSTQGHSGLW